MNEGYGCIAQLNICAPILHFDDFYVNSFKMSSLYNKGITICINIYITLTYMTSGLDNSQTD